MSLLDTSNTTVTVYRSVVKTDADGNTLIVPGDVGETFAARVSPEPQSGTSSRDADNNDEGQGTEQVYRLRFPRGMDPELDAQSRIEWNGQYWSVFGYPLMYSGSPRVRRYEYTIRRN